MSAQTRTEITRLLERHGIDPIHRLGQHFLADANITRKIVELAELAPGSRVLEIGAGTGTLTVSLASAGAQVLAYEVDTALRPVLEEVTGGLAVDLRFEDAMTVDLPEVLGPHRWKLVANLPYNVGTPLLLRALREAPAIERFVVMVQAEVAERLVARPGSRQYGLPSVVVGIHARGKIAFRVPPQVFLPVPNVGSAVVVLDRAPAPVGAEEAIGIAAVAFNQRRKMLRKSLEGVFEDPSAALESAGIDPSGRAEDLEPEDFVRLVRP